MHDDADINFGLGTVHRCDADMPPVGVQAFEIARHIIVADHIEDNVDPLRFFDKIMGFIIDRLVRAQRQTGRAFFIGSGGDNDFEPMAFAIWIAVVPMPDDPPWINRISPGFN